MGIVVKNQNVSPEVASSLTKLCPFGAIDYIDGKISINSGCKACKICVKKGPEGVCVWEEEAPKAFIDKSLWQGIAVYAQTKEDGLHPVTFELLGKARELANVIGQDVLSILIGSGVEKQAKELLAYGADRVYVYDDPAFSEFTISPYANALYDFIEKVKPGSILVGATNLGRSLAPKVAARCNTGLTADCTILEMKENSDLVQIRPAFGGNIMAQIVTPDARPQFCTVRYKIFTVPERLENPTGKIIRMATNEEMLKSRTTVVSKKAKPKLSDISDAELIVACGRGLRSEGDIALAKELADALGAELASTRPLVEAGWFDARSQIGLSGRTVKPKLIITLGVSGAVQFTAGMNGSERIIAINTDKEAPIFKTAHIGIVGDLYEVVPKLIEKIKGGKENV